MDNRTSKKRKLSDYDATANRTFRGAFTKATQLPFPVDKIVPLEIRERLDLLVTFYNTTICMLLAGLLPVLCLGMSSAKIQLRGKVRHLSLYCLIGALPGSGKSAAFDVGVEAPVKALNSQQEKDYLLKDFTKAALIQHLAANKSAIIASDEAYSILNQMLQRSEQGVGATGEQQLLCSLYTGGSYKAQYSQKEDVIIESQSGLNIAAYTQPDKMKSILMTLISSDDGLLDRFLVWVSGGQPRYVEEEEAAYDEMVTKGGGINLNELLTDVADLHDVETTYTFEDSALKLINSIRNELTRRVRKDIETPFVTELPDCVGNTYQTRYEEQLCRLSVLLHVLFQALSHKICSQVCVISKEIVSLDTVQRAKELMDFLTLQKEILLEAGSPSQMNSLVKRLSFQHQHRLKMMTYRISVENP